MAWNPADEALHLEALADPNDANPVSVLLEHLGDPFVVDLAEDKPELLQQAASAYLSEATKLVAVSHAFSLPSGWVEALLGADSAAAPAPYFGWLPFEPVDRSGSFVAPFGSFRMETDDGAMLFASQRKDANSYLGSGFGLAVPVHLQRDGTGQLQAWFVGFSATLPYHWFATAPLSASNISAFASELAPLLDDDQVRATVLAAASLDDVVFRGIRIAVPGGTVQLEFQGVGTRRVNGIDVPYAVTVQGTWKDGRRKYVLKHISPLVAAVAAGCGSVFVQDPSSREGRLIRPSAETLDACRASLEIGTGQTVDLVYRSGAKASVQVMPSRFARSDQGLDPTKPRPVKLVGADDDPAVRSEDASAVQAFFHGRDLLQRLEAYGWTDPGTYFRVMRPEVRIYYHSGISPGPGKDGRTVNARVIPEGWTPKEVEAGDAGDPRPTVFVHLAAADLRRRGRDRTRPWPAVPFGIGADRRWLWHEFGHVLLVASTGELELRFAHSAGDALAAIVADPASKLQDHRRAMTFPFVFLPRYHNRRAHLGWSWTGTQHAALASVPASQQPRRKGYASEQILSSSLFRLYRCIGGDTCEAGAEATPDRAARLRASHYTVFLIMKAIFLMGDVRTQVIATPAQFVHLLMQADRHAKTWSANYRNHVYERVGGTARKVIRWAFEAQGLYGSGNSSGKPPKVDVYIRDGRSEREQQDWGGTEFGPGSYVPVSLHWQPNDVQNPPAPAPLWQADPDAGIVLTNQGADVVVGNRGTHTANNVSVQLWIADWPDNQDPPLWNAAGWAQCTPASAAAGNIAAGASSRCSFTYNAPAGRFLLLAVAGCAADRANTDPALGLGCSLTPTRLDDLVPNDNNLALRVLP